MKTSLSEHYKKIAEELLECLKDARLEIEEWGAYSGEYFQDKYGLAKTLEQLDVVIEKNAAYPQEF